MCACEEEEKTLERLIFKCNKMLIQRNEVRQKMCATGLQRMKHSLLITKNFGKFVKSLETSDFK